MAAKRRSGYGGMFRTLGMNAVLDDVTAGAGDAPGGDRPAPFQFYDRGMTVHTGAESSKAVMHRYLRSTREALLWKLDGLSEYDARRPLTTTGTNLLGLVKHVAST